MKKDFYLDIWAIKKSYEEEIKNKIKKNRILYMNDFELKELFLKKDKSTIIKIQNENNNSNNILNLYQLNNASFFNQPNFHLSNTYQILSDSTFFDSKVNSSISKSIELIPYIYQFNSIRANFYLKNKLNDIPLIGEINNFNKSNNLTKYKINNELFTFVYPNDLITYSITITEFLSNKDILNYYLYENIEVNDSKYYPLLGLYFCGNTKEIEIENIVNIKKCLPNEFMCKKCMQINKRKYKLKKTYLININGRITNLNKGKYHCFGHFLIGNLIEDCISKFSCKACKIINYFSIYYN